MAVASIALRDRGRARQVLASVRRPVPAVMWERALAALEVLLEAIDGDAAAAETRAAAGLAAETVPAVRSAWRTARAHALAALHRREEALAELRELRAGEPDHRVLERVARQGGPASPLAESLLVDGGTAYRR
jgi:hypothetical protein